MLKKVAALLVLLFTPVLGRKVDICHFTNKEKNSWKTLNIFRGAAYKHITRHGDLDGPCTEFCDQLCGEGNKCNHTHCIECTFDSQDVSNDNDNSAKELSHLYILPFVGGVTINLLKN